MLVMSVRKCVWMDKCLLTRKAGQKGKRWQVAGSSRQQSFACSHTNPYKSFFFWKETISSLKKLRISLLSTLHTDDWLPPPCFRPLCNRTRLQIQQGKVELFPNSCAQTRWAAGRMKENGKINQIISHFGTFLYHSYPQPYITTPTLHGRGKVPERVSEGCSRDTVYRFAPHPSRSSIGMGKQI